MPEEPQIRHFDIKHRTILFWSLVLIFMCALPALMFYTSGYRISFEDEETSIVTTGGMYLTTDNLEVDVYLDDEQVERPRLFRSAYYIQNVAAGQHRVVVQAPGVHAWVKELPVDSRIVAEAAAFNMPTTPILRPIAPYQTSAGTPAYVAASSTIDLFPGATTSEPYVIATTSPRAANLTSNQEFTFVESLFSSSTATSTGSVFDQLLSEMERFRFATSSNGTATTATSTLAYPERGNVRLIDRERELYAVWQGSSFQAIPHYFCVSKGRAGTIAERYGEHVADAVWRYAQSTTTPLINDGNRLCRPEIKLNRLRQDVFFYDFFPGNNDLVLLQLENGLYVTEIDDRAWQNTQLVYPGDDFTVIVESGVIYIKDGEYYFELITDIES